ncbi:MAG: type II toxin-antitoxin system VapC family toxin [Deltaproteobacteria bacterium]|nr:type II toxin-antitoxin system VapC family toxin [Deltaproteobacteria bacterium]
MSWLLDTHALLWWLFDDPKLSSIARDVIADPANKIFVSSASAWEICTKHRIGKLPAASTLVLDIAGWVQRAGFSELPVTIAHAARAGSWPHAHRDPFDRMLAAQSMVDGLTLISRDAALRSFGVSLLW